VYHREIAKAKTAAKTITYDHNKLKTKVLRTIREASQLVGSTLGPNGKVILIERQENLNPYLSKDGITVFNSMAYADPTAQAILEAARDSSSKTNVEAGDGTTTATILAESLIRNGFEYLEENPRLSAQKIMRDLEKAFDNVVAPYISELSLKVTMGNKDDLLKKVATISTNNDSDMASAVMRCFDLVGTNGNVTIVEASGVSGFDVEKIEGFPVARGFEDSCGRFLEEFVNDKSNYRSVLERPKFLLYNGKVADINILLPILSKVGEASDVRTHGDKAFSPNLVVVAHEFGESVVANLAVNFKAANTIKVIPLKIPITYQANSAYHFLLDLAAFTGATVFDPVSKPIPNAKLEDLGLDSMRSFEYQRYKSMIIGEPDEGLLIPRVEELEQQSKNAESSYDAEILRERLALLTGGLARLKVYGSSEAELKEKRHRVEDAVCAVKGAIKEGVLPGCAKTLNLIAMKIKKDDSLPEAVKVIMGNALLEPFNRLLTNGGNHRDEIQDIFDEMMGAKPRLLKRIKMFLKGETWAPATPFYTYDALNRNFGDAVDIGVIDSASAVLYAVKNSLSVAKMLMSLSGIVVFKRDMGLDAEESEDYYNTKRAMVEAEAEAEREKWQPRI
jgi:chaperonin GroEL